jgi:hypothetical protein
MPTIGGGDDFVWIGGPDEGLWLLVAVGDEAIDGGLEIDDAFEEAALEAPLGEDCEFAVTGGENAGTHCLILLKNLLGCLAALELGPTKKSEL